MDKIKGYDYSKEYFIKYNYIINDNEISRIKSVVLQNDNIKDSDHSKLEIKYKQNKSNDHS